MWINGCCGPACAEASAQAGLAIPVTVEVGRPEIFLEVHRNSVLAVQPPYPPFKGG